jgi:hypothetical protein
MNTEEFSTFSVLYDGRLLEDEVVTANLVFHPYVFYNCQENTTHST